jgi:hypothetical protein
MSHLWAWNRAIRFFASSSYPLFRWHPPSWPRFQSGQSRRVRYRIRRRARGCHRAALASYLSTMPFIPVHYLPFFYLYRNSSVRIRCDSGCPCRSQTYAPVRVPVCRRAVCHCSILLLPTTTVCTPTSSAASLRCRCFAASSPPTSSSMASNQSLTHVTARCFLLPNSLRQCTTCISWLILYGFSSFRLGRT